jgi:hypothetical protein
MKQLSLFMIALLFIGHSSCIEDDEPKKESEYYIFTYRALDDPTFGAEGGFFKISPNKGSFQAERLNNYLPYQSWTDSYVAFNKKGMCAFYCDNSLTPSGAETQLAYFTQETPKNVNFLPMPDKVKDHTWAINAQKPIVTTEGKIIVIMSLYTDTPFDDWHDEFVAIYDPGTNKWDLGPSATGFVLSQPEKGSDTELGTISNSGFVLSQDESTIFLKASGWGVQGGSIHIDARYIAAYNIAGKNFEKLYVGDNNIYGASPTRVYFRSNAGYTAAVEIISKQVYPRVDDYPYDYYIFSSTKDQIAKCWRGSGLGSLTWNGSSYDWLHIINTDKLTSRTYAGLGARARYNRDESRIFFTASKDFNTNYAAEFAVMSTPIVSENPDPEIQFILPKNFSTYFFRNQ